MDDFANQREHIGKQLTLKLAQALKEGVVTQEEGSKIAVAILEQIDMVNSSEQMRSFLTTLSQQWPFFSEIAVLAQGDSIEKQDQQKVEEVSTLLKEHKLDEALSAVKTSNPI